MYINLFQLFEEYPQLAVIISISLSILIAVIGVVPSVFITAANILFFGFWSGTFISFLGEAIGAGIAFLLYRKGFKKLTAKGLHRYPRVEKLLAAENMEAFRLVFSLRLIPFVPSGLITFAAANGSSSFSIFLTASSLGKIPALLLEAYSVYEVTQFGWQGKLILVIVGGMLVYFSLKQKNKN